MSVYLFCFCLGFGGFVIMTLLGLSHSSSAGKRAHLPSGAKAGPAKGGVMKGGPAKAAPGAAHAGQFFLNLLGLPRMIFSLCFGFGATGLLLEGILQGFALACAAAVGAVIFDRLALTPMWTFLLRFASAPAKTLEDLVLEEVEAVTAFDARGEGLVLAHLDGRAVQLLARLARTGEGPRIRSGDRLSIIAVDSKRNSCTVTPIDPQPTL